MRHILLCLLIGCTTSADPGSDSAPLQLGPLNLEGVSGDIIWTCVGAPCPWGASLHNQAIAWPLAVGTSQTRLGYSADAAVYLPLEQAAHLEISLMRGTAQVHIGRPEDPLPWGTLAALEAGGKPWPVPVFDPPLPGMVLSVESTGDQFAYVLRQELP